MRPWALPRRIPKQRARRKFWTLPGIIPTPTILPSPLPHPQHTHIRKEQKKAYRNEATCPESSATVIDMKAEIPTWGQPPGFKASAILWEWKDEHLISVTNLSQNFLESLLAHSLSSISLRKNLFSFFLLTHVQFTNSLNFYSLHKQDVFPFM